MVYINPFVLVIIAFLCLIGRDDAFVVPNRSIFLKHDEKDLLSASSGIRPTQQFSLIIPGSSCSRGQQFIDFGLTTRKTTKTTTSLSAIGNFLSGDTVTGLIESLFSYNGNVPFLQSLGINVLGFTVLSPKLLSALTPSGFVNAMALGTMLWTTLGWRGWTYCVLYLLCGQLVTKVKFADKEKRGIAESRGGRRGAENVWGSAATALLCASCSVQGTRFLGISSELYLLAYCASLATKLADTFASEIGKAYGKTTFLITTLERVEPGTEGAISAEGTAAAMVGGLLLSTYGLVVGLINGPGLVVSTIAAFIATNVESLIGATIQEKNGLKWMTNEVVNFFNTLIGAGLAIVAGKIFLGMT